MSKETSRETDSGTRLETASKPARSSIEKFIVWGVIAAGLVLIAAEGSAWYQFKSAHGGILAELQRSEESTDFQVTRKEVEQILGDREPDMTKEIKVLGDQPERYDVYFFKGLLKERTLCVRYGVAGKMGEPEVIDVSSVIPDEIL